MNITPSPLFTLLGGYGYGMPSAVRMLGGMTDNPDAWVARLCAARLGGSDHYDKLHRLFDPGRQPDSLCDSYSLSSLPSLTE